MKSVATVTTRINSPCGGLSLCAGKVVVYSHDCPVSKNTACEVTEELVVDSDTVNIKRS